MLMHRCPAHEQSLTVDNETSFRVVYDASDLEFSHNKSCFITAGIFRIVNATDAMMEICYRNHEQRNKETRLP
jgi:hypothetical protein